MKEPLTDAAGRIVLGIAVSLVIVLPISISLWRERKVFHKKNTENVYVLRLPRFYFGLGLFTVAFTLVGFIMTVAVSKEWIGMIFLLFSFLGVYLFVHAMAWRVIVDGVQLEIHQLFKPMLTLDMKHIDYVEQRHNGIVVYYEGKKAFDVSSDVAGYELFYRKLYEMGKMESTQRKNSFLIRRSRGELAVGIICCLGFGGMLLWVLIRPNASVNWFVYLSFAGFLAMGVYVLLSAIRWRIEVNENVMITQSPLGKKRTTAFHQISRVVVKKNSIHIMRDHQVLIKVEPGCKGFAILLERLQAEGIAFCQK